ncbi:PIN domain-containing protein [Mahella australiensis]|uniref:PilT protein domain protein n=1 Tax=Mahella australiensis (strain DSM 15567 / CIP 107919 / 50-1 BON) TaxID=697281 RepID=F3ZWW9_MAHA5|nr:type II toxin-antitoxin system VapC family toxin [Mahella australiensis]AEE97591.1 PilT protein domain protein [Mahella australiensis 50-1 BON]
MSKSCNWVLDASAVLALINDEPGADIVRQAIKEEAIIGSVNFAELVSKLDDIGITAEDIRVIVELLNIEVVSFDWQLAYEAGLLRSITKQFGLSLGDRACIALGRHMNLPVITADRVWSQPQIDVDIRFIR